MKEKSKLKQTDRGITFIFISFIILILNLYS